MSAKKTDYLKHQLNKSPSKAAYTFSKCQRFPDAASTHQARYSKKKNNDMKSPTKTSSRFNVISRGSSRKQSFTENQEVLSSRGARSSSKRSQKKSAQKNSGQQNKPSHHLLNPDNISEDNRSYTNTERGSTSRRTSQTGSRLQGPSEASSRSGRLRSNPKSPGYTFATSPRRTADKFVKKDGGNSGPGTYTQFSEFGGAV